MKFKFEEDHAKVIKQLFSDYSNMAAEGLQIMNKTNQSKDDILKVLNFLNSRPAKEALNALNAFNASIAPQVKEQEDGNTNKEVKSEGRDS